MPKDLRSFLDELAERRPQDIFVVDREVDPEHEVCAIVEKFERENRFPLVFFKRIKGSGFPLVINLGATYERLALALGSPSVPQMVRDLAERERQPLPVREIPASEAPVKQVVLRGKDADLDLFPILVHNEGDAGKYINAAAMICRQRRTGAVNVGIYRHQKQGRRQLGLMINPANHGNYVRAEYEDHGEPMEVALAIGHHPALAMAAVSKQAGVGQELEVAGAFLGEPLEVVKAETVALMVPARSEIVIEGVVPPHKRHYEGPFGEWPHYYYKEGEQPYIEVTAITMRKNPIYQSIHSAHFEHNIIGAAPRLGSLFRRVQEAVPSLTGVNMPISGAARAHCYISLKKRAEGEPKQAALAAFVTDPNIKHVIVVDDDIDVFNETQVLWALAMRFQADRDLVIIPNIIGSHLNPTAYGHDRLQKGPMETKLIFDATKPLPPYDFPKEAGAPAEVLSRVDLARDARPYEPGKDRRVLTGRG
ncbi:MAG TPA: UbiD family decarboxylase [candidate division Zixibacteria bacterium]|nr:UbiD family decarboxylase [candidate division Zixibacteria bacterium]